MLVNWERWEQLIAAFAIVAEISGPVIKPEPIMLPAAPATGITSVSAPQKIHDHPAAKLTALYRENLLESSRVNAVTDTGQSVALKGNTAIGAPPRRHKYETDRFVFTYA